jgi:hypothetical protein
MTTTFTNNTVRTLGLAFAALVLLALPFAIAPKAYAADLGTGDYSGGDYSYGGGDYSGGDYSYAPAGDYSGGGYSYTPVDYSTPTYYDSGYSSYMPSYGVGGWYSSYGGYGGAPSNSNVNTNVNENYCTNGSCNTAINAPTNIVTNNSAGGSYPVYAPVYQPVYTPPVYTYAVPPISTNVGCGYTVVCPTVAYNTRPAPYVSLSAVPYTGLDLGPVGTALYWGFLILWCLGAAYLIVVKRVQNKLVSGLNKFLFGTSQTSAAQKSSGLLSEAKHASAGQTFVQHKSAPSSQFSGIDPFIASQISRAAF